MCDTKATADNEAGRANREAVAVRVLGEGTNFLVESMPEKLFAQKTLRDRPDIVAETQKVILGTGPAAVAGASRGMAARPDVTELLSTISVPTLVVVGEEDAISTVTEMSEMADRIPKATFRVISDAGHMSPLENPTEVNAAIHEFLAGL